MLIDKPKEIVISVYHSNDIDTKSEDKYDQMCVHLIDVSYDACDKSDILNYPASGPNFDHKNSISWEHIPAYFRRDWKRVHVIRTQNTDGLLELVQQHIYKNFDKPKIKYDVCGTFDWYAIKTSPVERITYLHDRWGYLVCLDDTETNAMRHAYIETYEESSNDIDGYFIELFRYKTERVVRNATMELDAL